MADIEMPQLGETVTEGTITKWFKHIGDQVEADEPLFEVSTDKVDSEVPAPASGYLAEIAVEEGDTVDVGTKLGVISAEAPSDGGGGGAPPAQDQETEAAAPEAEAPPKPEEGEAEPEEAEAQPAEAEAQPAEAETQAPPPATTPSGAPTPAEQEAAPEPEPEREPAAASANGGSGTGTEGKLLSPVVRRLISEHNLDANQIEGTGAGGRITRNDVLALVEDKGSTAPTARAPTPAGQAPDRAPAPAAKTGESATKAAPAAAAGGVRTTPAPVPAVQAGERDTVVPFTNIRRRTAEHMVMSKQVSAHVWVSTEVDFERVERVRQSAQADWQAAEGFGLTYLPFISRAVIDALADFPHVNASVGEDSLIVHNYVNLGIAVDLDFTGLIVPVVHDADGKRLRAIAREISDLASRARAKKLGADEILGGTLTITNPGPFGTLLTAPIINQPQVAILSTDGVKRRPVVVVGPDGDESIAIHSTGNLALTWDHRAFDGAYASAFLHKVGEILETRDWAAEL